MIFDKVETRYAELTYGKKWVTVFFDDGSFVKIRNYKLCEIFDDEVFGINKYYWFSSISLLKEKELVGNENEIQKMENEIIANYAIFLNEMVDCDKVQYIGNYSFRIFSTDKEGKQQSLDLSKGKMDEIFDNFREIYSMGSSKDVEWANAKPETERGKELLEIFRKAKSKIDSNKNGTYTLDSIIMGVSTRSNSYNLTNIFNLTVWQLMTTHKILNNIDYSDHYRMASAMGNIDTSKSKVTQSDLSWSSRKY